MIERQGNGVKMIDIVKILLELHFTNVFIVKTLKNILNIKT